MAGCGLASGRSWSSIRMPCFFFDFFSFDLWLSGLRRRLSSSVKFWSAASRKLLQRLPFYSNCVGHPTFSEDRTDSVQAHCLIVDRFALGVLSTFHQTSSLTKLLFSTNQRSDENVHLHKDPMH
uniref:Uncharacterized protein n=1 Tax=Salix viminalis TaxID=40686 RepID=A0A6N2M7M2_SALVM